MIFKNAASNQADIITLAFYHPKRRGSNPDFDEQSMQILSLKEREDRPLRRFTIVDPLLGSGFAIAVIPSRDAARTVPAFATWRNGSPEMAAPTPHPAWCATATIPKLACGGDRRVEVHLGSISVVEAHLIRGQEVLLLDDITTTGNSLQGVQDAPGTERRRAGEVPGPGPNVKLRRSDVSHRLLVDAPEGPNFSRKKTWKTVALLRRHEPSGIAELREMLLDSGLIQKRSPDATR